MDATRLAAMLAGELTANCAAIEPTPDMQVLAVDVLGNWGAGFRLRLVDGTARTDVVFAQRMADGGWEERGSGGGAFAGFDPPWCPPTWGWDGRLLLSLGTVGQATVDDDDEVTSLTVHYGFAAPDVDTVRSVQGDEQRLVRVTSPVGAYVVITLGNHEAPIEAEPPRARSPRSANTPVDT